MRTHLKKPLYRKVNTKTWGVFHNSGVDYKDIRNSKGPINTKSSTNMKQGVQRGLDYTPLFRFLLSKAGSKWDVVHSEAVSRLKEEAPIYWIVAKNRESAEEYIRCGENSYFSGLYIDKNGILCIVNPELDETSLEPNCKCCIHTFNGVPLTKKFRSAL